jgi:hypothetical protein
VKSFDIETANAHFQLTISEMPDGKGYVGKYYGTTPQFQQAVSPGAPIPMMKNVGFGKLTHKEIGALISACREEIEKRNGKIEKITESKE